MEEEGGRQISRWVESHAGRFRHFSFFFQMAICQNPQSNAADRFFFLISASIRKCCFFFADEMCPLSRIWSSSMSCHVMSCHEEAVSTDKCAFEIDEGIAAEIFVSSFE